MRAALASAVVTALVLAGCGGGGSVSSSQLRSQAADVCTAAAQRDSRIATPRSPADSLPFLRQGIAVLAAQLFKLQALKAPQELSQAYSQSLAAFKKELDQLNLTERRLASGGDPLSAIRDLQARLRPLEAAGDGAWQTLQIPACIDR